MNVYRLTIHFRSEEQITGSAAYMARGRNINEAKRFARAKFKTLNPTSRILRIEEVPPEKRISLGLRYTR